MGLTPLQGLEMGTRVGDVDASVVGWMMRNKGMSIDEVDEVLHKKSGLLGICGANDLRDVHALIAKGDEKAKLGLDILTYRIRGYIGSYLAQLGYIDALVFTAGVGENDSVVRRDSLKGLEPFGIILNEEENNKKVGEYALISAPASAVKVFVIRTNEELAIAEKTMDLI